jgi:hypothetical protein
VFDYTGSSACTSVMSKEFMFGLVESLADEANTLTVRAASL